MASQPQLEKSFRARYWAAQNRHLAAARWYKTTLLLERARQILERAKRLTQTKSRDLVDQEK